MSAYTLIHDPKALDKFCQLLDEDSHYLVAVMVKKRYSNKTYNLRSLFLNRDLVQGSRVKQTISRFQVPVGSYTDDDGTTIDNEDLCVYCGVNPRNTVAMAEELAINVIKKRALSNPIIELHRMAPKFPGRKKWLTLDCDFYHNGEGLDDRYNKVMEWLSNTFGDEVVNKMPKFKTRGGYHVLVPYPDQGNQYQLAFGKLFDKHTYEMFCDIKVEVIKDCLEPVPGCMQAGHKVIFI